ncbi:metal binding domain of Ada family protein [Pochonia chlamydosporia 170]|uniref:Metal binding domain of Ada family protein n=1 Tax=Pochonia chlamydosporia 170 TaxID=1380566 RepID=A0A179FB16_METCM|nr:metal binding domain of Ada family protein [Pochonia chlamydosporia 170]OAQ62646.1 metal binding domain of Ada family protein [Pochonia chlamydosporia 170]
MHPTPKLTLFDDDDSRWQAVQTRDAVADGFFVYAVKTTKVYCRPICKARLARRSNVTFYSTGAEAQNAGFRACKRCKPEMEGFMPEERAVQQIRKFVLEEAVTGEGKRLSLSQMAKKSGLSKWHFHRVFKRTVGVTPFEYLKNERVAWGDAAGVGGLWDGQLDGAFGLGFWNMGLETDGSTESVSVSSGLVSVGASGGSGSPLVDLGLEMDDLLVWPDEMG